MHAKQKVNHKPFESHLGKAKAQLTRCVFFPEALAGSSVKIRGRDVLATWKLLVGLILIPTLYALYSLIAFVFAVRMTDWSWTKKCLFPIAVWNLLPFVSYASLRFGENGVDVYK